MEPKYEIPTLTIATCGDQAGKLGDEIAAHLRGEIGATINVERTNLLPLIEISRGRVLTDDLTINPDSGCLRQGYDSSTDVYVNTVYGSDGVTEEPGERDDLTDDDRHIIAEHMIAKWKAWGVARKR